MYIYSGMTTFVPKENGFSLPAASDYPYLFIRVELCKILPSVLPFYTSGLDYHMVTHRVYHGKGDEKIARTSGWRHFLGTTI